MTADEVAYAGGVAATELTSPYAWYYLNSAGGSITAGRYWWLLSPYIPAFSWVVYAESNGPCLMDYRVGWRDEYDEDLQMSGYVRPVISIKGDTLSSGDGSPENPYEIVYN